MSLANEKAAARKAAFQRRKEAAEQAAPGASGELSACLAGYRGVPLAGYLPIRMEIDPLPAMAEAAAYGPVGVPVIQGDGQPLKFRAWDPDCTLINGPFGVQVPEVGEWIDPEILIVPLVAFTSDGARLGYGGGYYDRTLEKLRAAHGVLAIGFAYLAQEAEVLPVEETDQRLDMIVTETGVIRP